MRRLRLGLVGLATGLALGLLAGACECPTIDVPLVLGTYGVEAYNTWDYQLVLGTGGRAIETYPDGVEMVRVEYTLGPSGPVP